MSILFKPGLKPLCVIPLVLATRSSRRAAARPRHPHATTSTAQTAAARSSRRTDSQGSSRAVSNGVSRSDRGTERAALKSTTTIPVARMPAANPPPVENDPCTLVSQAQAQAIIGKPIGTPQEAPLGPTCIYRPVGAKSFITMTVESTNFAALRAAHPPSHAARCQRPHRPTAAPTGSPRCSSRWPAAESWRSRRRVRSETSSPPRPCRDSTPEPCSCSITHVAFGSTPKESGREQTRAPFRDGFDGGRSDGVCCFPPAPRPRRRTRSSAPPRPRRSTLGDGQSVVLGVKFSSEVAGSVTGIRFYKATTNTGTHIGSLWTTSGTLLASATFTGETASGWQQVSFSTPVAIAAQHDLHRRLPGAERPLLRHLLRIRLGRRQATRRCRARQLPCSSDGVYAYSATNTFPTQHLQSDQLLGRSSSSNHATPLHRASGKVSQACHWRTDRRSADYRRAIPIHRHIRPAHSNQPATTGAQPTTTRTHRRTYSPAPATRSQASIQPQTPSRQRRDGAACADGSDRDRGERDATVNWTAPSNGGARSRAIRSPPRRHERNQRPRYGHPAGDQRHDQRADQRN